MLLQNSLLIVYQLYVFWKVQFSSVSFFTAIFYQAFLYAFKCSVVKIQTLEFIFSSLCWAEPKSIKTNA